MDTNEKIIEIMFTASQITDEILKSVLLDFTKGKADRGGKMPYYQIQKQGKLENIEVSEDNLKIFNSVAGKYNLSYSVKAEKNTDESDKRNYHVYFKARDSDTMLRAFKEYAGKITTKDKIKVKAEIPVEKLQKVSKDIEQAHKQEKVRERAKNKEVSL